jgi:hypothetical protein
VHIMDIHWVWPVLRLGHAFFARASFPISGPRNGTCTAKALLVNGIADTCYPALMNVAERAGLRNAVAAAMATFVAGFGALFVMFELGNYPTPLPGLFDYWSATVGDGVVLPIIIGSLVYSWTVLPAVRLDRFIAGSAFILGCASGVATQAIWLQDSHPRVNWTFPHPHQFNHAGIYHALFLSAACGVIPALWTGVLFRTIFAPQGIRKGRSANLTVAIASTGSALFVFLLLLDNKASASTHASQGTARMVTIGLSASIVFLVGMLATRLGVLRSGLLRDRLFRSVKQGSDANKRSDE